MVPAKLNVGRHEAIVNWLHIMVNGSGINNSPRNE